MIKPLDLSPKVPLLDRLAGGLVAGAIGLSYRTSSPPPLWNDHIDQFRALHPFILAVWHGQFMLLPALPRDDLPTRVMIALHRDAELMAYALRRHDLTLIRGAGAGIRGKDRGGAQAFRGAIGSLAQGYTVAMTADVPPGPARKCGLGIVTLARISGRPILPVALASSRYISLKTWSRMTINLPGSQLGGSIGEVIRVPADANDEDMERYRLMVERQLDIATVDAYARAGVTSERATPPHALDPASGQAKLSRGLRFYRGGMQLLRPLAPVILGARARRGKEEPARQGERFGIASAARPDGTLVWMHAASVGETNAVLPLIADMARANAKLRFLLTTGTVTSAKLAAARLSAGAIHQYLPLDVPDYVSRFLVHWRPDLGVFTESEIWPNLILEADRRGVPLAIVNARLSKGSFRRWRKRPATALPIFSRFQTVLAQNEQFGLYYNQLGARGVLAVGNLKVDAPPPPVDAELKSRLTLQLAGRPVWLAASTHADEEIKVARAHRLIAAAVPGLVTIIAPRHPVRGPEIAAELRALGIVTHRRDAGEPLQSDTSIYVVDTLGELGTLFALAPLTLMGKSLIQDGGGHNPIEPIRHGSAVLTGPHWGNFTDAFSALRQANGMVQVGSVEQLATEVTRLLSSPDDLARLRANGAKALDRMSGALPKTVVALLGMLRSEAVPRVQR